MAVKLIYEPNPKHKEPWHHGKSGTRCLRWTWDIAQEILEGSDVTGSFCYGVRDGMAFKGYEHAPGRWHGYPVAWNEVPVKLVNQWIAAGRVTRREVHSSSGTEALDQHLKGGSR